MVSKLILLVSLIGILGWSSAYAGPGQFKECFHKCFNNNQQQGCKTEFKTHVRTCHRDHQVCKTDHSCQCLVNARAVKSECLLRAEVHCNESCKEFK